jgi:hypothetical protein
VLESGGGSAVELAPQPDAKIGPLSIPPGWDPL